MVQHLNMPCTAVNMGIDFRRRFLWRMAVLYVIGFVNTIFYSADILTLYAVMGVVMVAVYRWKNWALVLLSVVLLCGGPRLSFALLSGQEQTVVPAEVAQPTDGVMPANDPSQSNPAEWGPENNPLRSFVEQQGQMSFADSVKMNLFIGLLGKVAYQFFMSNRGFVTLEYL